MKNRNLLSDTYVLPLISLLRLYPSEFNSYYNYFHLAHSLPSLCLHLTRPFSRSRCRHRQRRRRHSKRRHIPLLPLFGVKNGGLELAATGNETCPLTVVQSRTAQIFRGLPVRISSPYRIAYISEGLILNLAFASSPSCAPTPPNWTVVKGLPEGQGVKLPGYGRSTVSGWFKIEKSSLEYLYKLVFCARASKACGEIGISVDDEGIKRLVLTEEEGDGIIVEFMKASSVSA
ncbi:hypothetical protein JHK87_050656 [Glycine soja]|nr:hypothetical protein JHK87_050656 [Glycine soja]